MSGGHWNYQEAQLISLCEEIFDDISARLQDFNSEFKEYELSMLLMASVTALRTMHLAYVHMRRLDYLYSGDDSFETFEERLLQDMHESTEWFHQTENQLRELMFERVKKLSQDQ